MRLVLISTLVAVAIPFSQADIVPVNLPSGFFSGPQSGIGSWYQASSSQDSTNGKSWCEYQYFNSDPLFAVSLKAMGGQTYNSNAAAWRAATQKYCGLEALVTDPKTGKQMLMYIGDAFEDQYVRTPASIDIMINGFSELNGNPNGDKNIVINPVKWELTGNMNTKYTAKGAVLPTRTPSPPKPIIAAPEPSSTNKTVAPTSSSTPPGGLGSKCSSTVSCPNGLTCLSPDGVCSDKACNWGCEGWNCGPDTQCQLSLTCVSPDGICKNQACNWGCTAWSCSASSPCQLPNTCVSGTCKV